MKHNTPQNWKFKKLVRSLRAIVDSRFVSIDCIATGLLERLWHAAIVSAPAGDIGKLDDEVIAELAGWLGEPEALIEMLIHAGFLDRSDQHRLVVHDWEDHCPAFVKGNLAKHKKSFARSKQPNPTKPNPTKPDLTKPNLTGKQGANEPAKQGAKQPAKQNVFAVAWSQATSSTLPARYQTDAFRLAFGLWHERRKCEHRGLSASDIVTFAIQLRSRNLESDQEIAVLADAAAGGWKNLRFDQVKPSASESASGPTTFEAQKTKNTLGAVERFMTSTNEGSVPDEPKRILN